MKRRGAALVAIAAVLAAGCAALDAPHERAARVAAEAGFARIAIEAGPFTLLAYLRRPSRADTLTVYLESDGAPWPRRDQPPADPTPLDPFALRLAAADPAPAVAWIARPCQYAAQFPPRDCDSRYWRGARYAPEVVEAMDAAVTRLAREAGATRLVLVGHSGGGAIAALLAARRADAVALVTVGGVLDAAHWTTLHRVTPLADSLDPVDAAPRTRHLRQHHYVGEGDTVTPPAIAESFARRAGLPDAVVRVPGRDHDCCWTADWPARIGAVR